MNVLSERLDAAFKALGLTAHKFEKKHKGRAISRATLFNVLNSTNYPRFDTVVAIRELEPSISAEYLLRGIGNPIKPDYALDNNDPCAEYISHISRQAQESLEMLNSPRNRG
jgi:hypothetical protein